jgi:Protein of unknown function (DUF1501)
MRCLFVEFSPAFHFAVLKLIRGAHLFTGMFMVPDEPRRKRPRPPIGRLHRLAGRRRCPGRHDHGMTVAENKCHIHDLHATLLHLAGIDHTRLTYRYSGRDFRLTDVYGEILTDILA